MTGALILLAVTVAVGFILWLTHRPDADTAEPAAPEPGAEEPEQCCGLHAVCEKQLADLPDRPIYYDDEELDRFARRDPATYTDDEVDEFRRVLYTLIPSDVYPWGASLTLREIALPYSLRDEFILLCEEKKAD